MQGSTTVTYSQLNPTPGETFLWVNDNNKAYLKVKPETGEGTPFVLRLEDGARFSVSTGMLSDPVIPVTLQYSPA